MEKTVLVFMSNSTSISSEVFIYFLADGFCDELVQKEIEDIYDEKQNDVTQYYARTT